MKYLPRTIEKTVLDASDFVKVILLAGMRQVGKSTVLEHLASERRSLVTLDNLTILDEAKSSPELFFKLHPLPIVINEIQRAPELFLPIKEKVDTSHKTGLIWLTGSRKFELMHGMSDSLAGRLLPLELMPMSIYEREGLGLEQLPYLPSLELSNKLGRKTPSETWRLIWQGAWPAVLEASERHRKFFFDGLLQTFIEKDVKAEDGVSKLLEFHRFLRILASCTGQELRVGGLANDTGVSVPTVKKWLSIVEASGLVFFLKPYYANVKKQLVKSPKLYFVDTGIVCHLLQLESAEELRKYKDSGAIFETFVVSEILKSWVHNGERPDFYFYRDSKTQQEIDLLIRSKGRLYPVEIKSSTNPNRSAIKSFSVLKDLPEQAGTGAVICQTETPYALEENCLAVSIWNL